MIIAIVLAVGVILVFFMTNKNSSKSDEFFNSVAISSQLDFTRGLIVDCAKTSAKEALDTIGLQGGFYRNIVTSYKDVNGTFIPYFYDKGELNNPNKSIVERELGYANDYLIDKCISNITTDLTLTHPKPKSNVEISKGIVKIKTDLPITIEKEDHLMAINLKDFAEQEIDSKLYEIIEVSHYISNYTKYNPQSICITCINEMAVERNLYVDSFSLPPDSEIYIISENSTSAEPYSFLFMNRFSGTNFKPLAVPKVSGGGE